MRVCVFSVHPLSADMSSPSSACACVCVRVCVLVGTPRALCLGVCVRACANTCPFVLDQPSVCLRTRVFAFLLRSLSPACVDVLGSLRACWAACVPVCTGSSRIPTHVHACVLNRHRAPCTSGAFVQCLSVVMTVLSVSQASSVLGLPGAIRSGWPGPSQGPPRPQTGCPIPAALSQEPPPPAGHPPACHLCWLNLGARVRQPSQVPGHMGGCI